MIFFKNYPVTWKVRDIHDFCKAYGKIDDEKDDEGKPKLNEDGS